jgi:uncharacterized protein YfdQ (DUF2303 family)
MDSNSGDASAILAAAKRFAEPNLLPLNPDHDVLLVPEGRRVESVKKYLDEYRTRPERRTGIATTTTLRSFVHLVNRFKDKESAIFADNNAKAPKLLAVLNYNPAETEEQEGEARFGDHRVVYDFPVSVEWSAWTGKNGAEMSQADFAQFLEDRVMDVGNPAEALSTAKDFAAQLGITLASPQRLMELSRGLSIRVNSKFTQAVKLSSGEAQVGFEEAHEDEAGGPVKIPGGFAIRIPVFRDGEAFEIPVRLKYRPVGSTVLWSFTLQRVEKVWDLVIGEACASVEKDTALPLYFGTPEK